MNWLLIFLGGGTGSVIRFLISKYTLKSFSSNLPLGTFVANIIACLILALTYFIFTQKGQQQDHLKFLIITGFCGGLSTFSTFGMETFQLIKNQLWGYAILNVLISVAVGLGIIYLVYKGSDQT